MGYGEQGCIQQADLDESQLVLMVLDRYLFWLAVIPDMCSHVT